MNPAKLEVILDASQITTFESCPKKWYYDHILNLTSRKTNTALSTGTWFHEVLKVYFESAITDPPVSKHIKKAVEYAIELATGPRAVEWPRIKKDPKFHLDRLKSYLINNMHEDDGCEILAVEKGFSWLLFEDENRRYILEGMIDIIKMAPKMGLVVQDHKTQQRYDEIYNYNHQVCNYLAFTGANYFEYDYIGQQATQNENTFHRPIFKPPPGFLDQWKIDVRHTFDQMAAYAAQGNIENNFPRRRAACDSKYGTCQFHRICETPDNSRERLIVLQAYKPKEKIWKAWA